METSANVSKCFQTTYWEKSADEFLEDQPCHFEDQDGEGWQEELEHFWGGRKHRHAELEQVQQLSSSLERHLLFDECLQEPEEVKESKDEPVLITDANCVVRGEDINDVPTQYVIGGFEPNEFIVIGTYVDKRVIPGFKYVVRKNLTEKYLFQGKALRLEQIGLGYGKRLTFQSPTLNENNNYFWSDSCAAGFGFKLQAIFTGDIFTVFDPSLKASCGRVVVTEIEGDQIEKATVFGEDGSVEKIVTVKFRCNVVLADRTNNQVFPYTDVFASGTVVLVKENNRSAVAEIQTIKLNDFIVDSYELRPYN